MKKLTAIEKSNEIRDLAQKFMGQVYRDDVHTPAGQGDGYAIDSDYRDHSIGTIAAPTTLSADIDWLAQELAESCMPDELPLIVNNLKKAQSSLASAYNAVKNPRGLNLGGHKDAVEGNLRQSLPAIERAINKINDLNH